MVTLEFEHQPPFRVQGGFMEGAGGSRNQTQAVQIYPEIKHKQYKYTPKSGASSTSTPRNQTRAVQMHHEIKRKQYTYTPKSYARNENYCTIRSRFESSYLRRRSAVLNFWGCFCLISPCRKSLLMLYLWCYAVVMPCPVLMQAMLLCIV